MVNIVKQSEIAFGNFNIVQGLVELVTVKVQSATIIVNICNRKG